jgi:hypothetical protein
LPLSLLPFMRRARRLALVVGGLILLLTFRLASVSITILDPGS